MDRDIETLFEELENIMSIEWMQEKVSDLKQKTLQAIATARADALREGAWRFKSMLLSASRPVVWPLIDGVWAVFCNRESISTDYCPAILADKQDGGEYQNIRIKLMEEEVNNESKSH